MKPVYDQRGQRVKNQANIYLPAPREIKIRPRQIADPPSDFTGREEDLADIHFALDHGERTIVIYGMGGVGKTTLAQRLAQDLLPQYPFQLHLDLKGTDDKPLTPEEAMSKIIRSLHPSIALPSDTTEIENLYTSVLHNKAVIILADNARNASQVQPLIKKKTCCVIVTSRDQFLLPDSYPRLLEVLRPEVACQFLASIVKRIPTSNSGRTSTLNYYSKVEEFASDIVAMCGCLPLAVRAAGSFLGVSQKDPLNYAEELQSEVTRLQRIGNTGVDKGVEASIGLSYKYLPESTRELFEKLSVFRHEFDRDAEKLICDDTANNEHLNTLVEYSLVEYHTVSDKYKLHDLVRIFASARLHDKKNYNLRYAIYYLEILEKADRLYRKGAAQAIGSRRLIDANIENIVSGQRFAAELFKNEPSDMEFARLCIGYTQCDCISQRLFPATHYEWQMVALMAGEQLNDVKITIVQHGASGSAHTITGELMLARNAYLNQLQLARTNNDQFGESDALGNLGNVYLELGEIDTSLNFYRQQIASLHKIKDRHGKHIALANLGIAYRSRDPDRALRILTRELVYARAAGDLHSETIIRINLGLICCDLGDTNKAIKEFYREARNIAQRTGDQRNEAIALWNMSLAYANGRKNYERAIFYATLAAKLFEGIEERNLQMIQAALEDWQLRSIQE